VNRAFTLIFCSMIWFVGCLSAAENTGKPVRTIETISIAPDSVDGLWNDSQLAVRVRVLDSRAGQVSGERRTRFFTVHRARILDVLKGEVSVDCATQAPEVLRCAPVVGQDMEFLQYAGEFETDDEIVRYVDEPLLLPEKEYVVFLSWNASVKGFVPIFGRNGTFEVRRNAIHAMSAADVPRELEGRTTDDFKRTLPRKAEDQ
jgi:hypothetical protein